jgi:WD40 repeat protein
MVTALSASSDGRILAVGTQAAALQVWDLATSVQVRAEKGVANGVQAVALAPGGKAVAAGGFDKKVRVFPLPSGDSRVLEGLNGRVGQLAWSPDGALLAAAGNEDRVLVWDAATGTLRRELKGHQGFIVALAWSPDGTLIASSGQDGTVRLWPVSEGAPQVLKLHSPRTAVLGFLPSGELLSGGADGRLIRSSLRD